MEFAIEEWRSIQSSCGFELTENKYEVSSFGRVRNVITRELYSTNPRKTDDYVVISLSLRNGKRRNFYLQRLIYDTFKGPLPDDLVVDHLNFNRSDNCIWNLVMCTQEENINRSLERGRMKIIGSKNNKATLKESDVDMICLEFESGNFNYSENTYTAIKDELIKLIDSGKTITEIANIMNINISDRKVYQKFHKYISRLKK